VLAYAESVHQSLNTRGSFSMFALSGFSFEFEIVTLTVYVKVFDLQDIIK
jgi:hypothetical protein